MFLSSKIKSLARLLFTASIFTCFICTSGCIGHMPDGWAWYKPKLLYFHPDDLPNKDADYTKGFNDGCQAHLTLTGGLFTILPNAIDGWKLAGKDPQNPKNPYPGIKDSSVYATGFRDGTEICFYYFEWDIT